MGLITAGDGIGIPEANRVVLPSTVDVYDDAGQLIGYATKIDVKGGRSVDRIRHLSSASAGRTIEQVPGVEEVTVTLEGFALYNEVDSASRFPHYSLAGRISGGTGTANHGTFLFKSLSSQKIPFTIKVEEVHPADAQGSKARNITYYRNCMLKSFGKSISTGSVTTTETAEISVGQVDDVVTAAIKDTTTILGA